MKKFLHCLRLGWTVTSAARACSISRRTFYDWRLKEPRFAKLWDEAVEEGTDRIEQEAFRRSVVGVDEPLVHQGKTTGEKVRRYDNNLLKMLLGARRPEKFRERGTLDANLTGTVKLVVEYEDGAPAGEDGD